MLSALLLLIRLLVFQGSKHSKLKHMIILIILGIILVVTSFTLKPIKIHYLNFQISLKSLEFC
jgi:uncharacterized membrane protein